MQKPFYWKFVLLISFGFILAGFVTETLYSIQNEDRSEWIQNRKKEFEQYRTSREKQFQQYLEKRWKEMQVFAGQEEDTVPKPEKFPVANPENSPEKHQKSSVESVGKNSSQKQSRDAKKTVEVENSQAKRSDHRSSNESNGNPPVSGSIQIDYYGNNLSFSNTSAIEKLTVKTVDQSGIASFWKEFSGKRLNNVLDKLESTRQRLDLDGWGYLQLVRKLSERIHEDRNISVLTTWGLMLKSDFGVRVGYSNEDVFLLVNTNKKIYERPYFNYRGKRYYLLTGQRSESVKQIKTYQQSYPGEKKTITFNLAKKPDFSHDSVTRTINFQYNQEDYEFTANINRNMVKYYSDLPQLPLKYYFTSTEELRVTYGFSEELRNALEKIPSQDRINFLLRFVQKGLDYKTDQEQFGHENYLMPQETLFHPYSDCEDRALLFTSMVRDFMDRRVLGLDYPGHVATAVATGENPRGTYFEVNEVPYSVADPTYTNADAGMTIPRYDDVKPKIIPTG